jgi:hypothetical protein
MRPEYIEAVEAVRGGWAYWLIYILPAFVIWSSMFLTMLFRSLRPLRCQILIICGAFILACYLYLECHKFYINRIWDTKEANMQTEEERLDWSGDVGRVFTLAFAPWTSFCYCTINLILAGMIRLLILCSRRINETDRHES